MIERSILATDLALHFRDAQALSKLATSISQCPNKLDALITEENSQSKHLMQAGTMTAADLGNATKVKESRDFAAVLYLKTSFSYMYIFFCGQNFLQLVSWTMILASKFKIMYQRMKWVQ